MYFVWLKNPITYFADKHNDLYTLTITNISGLFLITYCYNSASNSLETELFLTACKVCLPSSALVCYRMTPENQCKKLNYHSLYRHNI